MRTATIFVLLSLILVASFTPRLALGEGELIVETISITTDDLSYFVGESIVISGEVTVKKMPIVAIKIFDPDDNILGAYSVDIDETSHFTKTIIADIPFYEKSGAYTITAEYGKLKTDTIFEIENGPNETTDSAPNLVELPTILPKVISFETDRKKYQNEDTIFINGKVSVLSDPQVTIAIFDPNKIPVGIYLGTVNPDLTFSVSFLAKYNVNFKVEGTYSLTAQYGGPETKQNIEIEFFEKINESVTTVVPNPIEPEISESPDTESSNSFLLLESDLENLATWYYLDETDEKLSILFNDLLKRKLIDPDVDGRISKNTLILWIQDTELLLGIAIDDLFKENISEEEFLMFVENSLTDFINKSFENSQINNVQDTSQINNVQETPQTEIIHELENPEIESSEVDEENSKNIEDIENISDEVTTETVYFNSSENCKINLYEDIVTYFNNPGPALARLCKYEEAITNYDQDLSSNPKNINALTNKGSALAGLGRYQDAIINFDKVLEIDPQNVIALNNKANALSSIGRYQEAILNYDKALEIDSQNVIVLTNKEKSSSFLTVYHPQETEQKIVLISEESTLPNDNEPIKKTDKDNDIVEQFANMFSSISASLLSLFSG